MSSSTQKTPGLTAIMGMVVLVIALATIIFANSEPVEVSSVNARLQEFSDRLVSEANDTGMEASFTHGKVTLAGSGYEKYVIVQDLHLSLAPKGAGAAAGWTVDIPKITVVRDALNYRRLIFRFAKPFMLVHNGEKTQVTFQTPLKFGYFESDEDNVESLSKLVTLRLPAQITMSPLPEGDAKDRPTLVINYDATPELSIKTVAATKQTELTYETFDIRNITVQAGKDSKANIGAISNTATEMPNDNHVNGTFSMTVSDLIRPQSGKLAHTCSIATNIGYDSSQSLMMLLGRLPSSAAISAKVNKLMLACDEFTIKMDGSVTQQPSDTQLIGQLNVTIIGPKAFLASDLLSDQTRSELTAALPKITGKPIGSDEKIAFAIKRDANGPMMLGAVRMEDAGITVLKAALAPGKPEGDLSPAATAQPKPDAASKPADKK